MSKQKVQCIMCRRNIEGLPVKIDGVINTVRWFAVHFSKKTELHRLVVCKDCYITYVKARKRYLRRRNSYIILGILFTMMLCSVAINSVTEFLVAIVVGLIITAGMYLLSLLSYVPGLEEDIKKQNK